MFTWLQLLKPAIGWPRQSPQNTVEMTWGGTHKSSQFGFHLLSSFSSAESPPLPTLHCSSGKTKPCAIHRMYHILSSLSAFLHVPLFDWTGITLQTHSSGLDLAYYSLRKTFLGTQHHPPSLFSHNALCIFLLFPFRKPEMICLSHFNQWSPKKCASLISSTTCPTLATVKASVWSPCFHSCLLHTQLIPTPLPEGSSPDTNGINIPSLLQKDLSVRA